MTDIDIDRGLNRFEVGEFGQVGLLMLRFDCMIRRAAIDIMAIDTNTHSHSPRLKATDVGIKLELLRHFLKLSDTLTQVL